MSYKGKLFKVIPYEVRVNDEPYYLEEDIEAMLGLHYGSVSSVLIYVESVFNDDKHAGNVLYIKCLDDAGKSYVSFDDKDEYGVNLHFITSDAIPIEIAYAYQIDYAVEKHFTHDRQLTILPKDQIDRKFDFDLQAKVVQSAKDYVAKNKTDLDKIINSDTPGRVGVLIRAHLAGIEFTPFDDPSDLIQKIEDEVRAEHAYKQEPPYGKSLYDACLKTTNFVDLFNKRIEDFMDRNNLILDVFETNPEYAIRSAFEHWAMSEYASNYSDVWEAFDKFFEENKNNSDYFKKQENTVKRACKELGITQKELADKLGASEGTVRNWSSSNELPQWAINFIEVLKENQKNKEIADTVKKLINLVKTDV